MEKQILEILENNSFISHKQKWPVKTGFLENDGSQELVYEEEKTNLQLAKLITRELVGDCSCECNFTMPYGFVPEAGCEIHDKKSKDE